MMKQNRKKSLPIVAGEFVVALISPSVAVEDSPFHVNQLTSSWGGAHKENSLRLSDRSLHHCSRIFPANFGKVAPERCIMPLILRLRAPLIPPHIAPHEISELRGSIHL